MERWELLGTERLTCGVFPSDHFGISCLLRLPLRARPGFSSGLPGVGERGEGVAGAGVGGGNAAGGSVNGQTTAATMAEDEPAVVVLD